MVDVCELTRFAASGRVLRLVMDIAAALERYKIAMEGPEGVRLRKLNRIRTIRGTTAIEGNTLTEAQVTGDAAPFVEFMLNVILRTIRAKGVPKSATGGKKSGKKGGKKTEDRILALLTRNPKLTFAGMVAAIGISRSAIQKHIERLKDAQRLRRVGPDKGGRWEVAKCGLVGVLDPIDRKLLITSRRFCDVCSVGSSARASGCMSADSGVRGYCAPAENMP